MTTWRNMNDSDASDEMSLRWR